MCILAATRRHPQDSFYRKCNRVGSVFHLNSRLRNELGERGDNHSGLLLEKIRPLFSPNVVDPSLCVTLSQTVPSDPRPYHTLGVKEIFQVWSMENKTNKHREVPPGITPVCYQYCCSSLGRACAAFRSHFGSSCEPVLGSDEIVRCLKLFAPYPPSPIEVLRRELRSFSSVANGKQNK